MLSQRSQLLLSRMGWLLVGYRLVMGWSWVGNAAATRVVFVEDRQQCNPYR